VVYHGDADARAQEGDDLAGPAEQRGRGQGGGALLGLFVLFNRGADAPDGAAGRGVAAEQVDARLVPRARQVGDEVFCFVLF